MSPMFLEKALNHLNDIALYMTPLDPSVQDELAELGQRLAVALETVIIKDAMNKKIYYKPKYI